MPANGKRIGAWLAFAIALAFAPALHIEIAASVTQAVVWLPTGVAIAGLWLLGLRAAGIVTVCTLCFRLVEGYPLSIAVFAAIGSTLEAVAGVLVLRRLRLRGDFANLRDVVALFACAIVAPCFSLALRIARSVWLDLDLTTTAFQRWDGWLRMNALGVLIVVPVVLTCLQPARQRLSTRTVAEAITFAGATIALVAAVMTRDTPPMTSLMLLYLLLPVALAAAMRFGPRGTICTSTLGAMVILDLAAAGVGPFVAVGHEQRIGALQIFLFTLVCVPLVFGALVAERESTTSRWQESEGLRRALMQVSPDVNYRIRADGTFVDVMAPPGASLPIAARQLLGRRYHEFASPEVAEKWSTQIAKARHGAPSEPVEYPVNTTNGRRDREVRFVHLPNDEVLGVVRDITDRKRAERQLTWQAQMLEQIAAGRPLAETLLGLVQGIESFLAPCFGSISLRRGERLFGGCAPSLPKAIVQRCEGLEIRADNGACGTAAFEGRTIVCADLASDPRWIDYWQLWAEHGLRACWSVPVRSADGAVLGTFAVYHAAVHTPTDDDLAFVERAATLAALSIENHRRANLLASIERNVGEGLFRCAQGSGLVYVNEAFARLFGYDSPQQLLRGCADAGDSEHDRCLQQLSSAPTSQPPTERCFTRRDGSTFFGLLSMARIVDSEDSEAAFVGTIADVTTRHELEDQLRHSQKLEAVGQLAGGVAHDFNNMLSAIYGYSESLRDGLPVGSELRADAEEVLAAATRAAALTHQLLAFARRQVLKPTVIDLGAAIAQLGAMLQRLIGEHISFVNVLPAAPVCARVDRGQFEQVVVNLVLNARDAMPAGGNLTIRTEVVESAQIPHFQHTGLQPGPHAAITVRDTGLGMTAEVLARAFDPFFTTKEPGKGTGLGLSTVHGIVHQSDGAVWIDSVPGEGTKVSIFLPFVDSLPEALPIVPIPRHTARRGTVLVVEDEPLVRDIVVRALTQAGFRVKAASDGREALTQFAAHRRELVAVISDVVMPNMGGIELSREIWREAPRLPVLFMSGYTQDDNRLGDIDGRSGFVQKPFTVAAMLASLDELMTANARLSPAAPGAEKP